MHGEGFSNFLGPVLVNSVHESFPTHFCAAEYSRGKNAGCQEEKEFWVDLGWVMGTRMHVVVLADGNGCGGAVGEVVRLGASEPFPSIIVERLSRSHIWSANLRWTLDPRDHVRIPV